MKFCSYGVVGLRRCCVVNVSIYVVMYICICDVMEWLRYAIVYLGVYVFVDLCSC